MRRQAALILVATILAALAACHRAQGPGGGAGKNGKGGDERIPVTVAAVTARDVPLYLDGLGTVNAFNTATIRAQVSGKLVAVPFKEGDEVKAGDLLAQLDPRPFQATLDQALAKKAQDQAALNSARLDLKRYLDLLPSGYIDAQQADQQRALVQQDEALIRADEAAIEGDRVQVSYCHIQAPFAGVVGIRQVDVGNLVSASDSSGIAVLTQIKPIAVQFTLPEQALAAIRAQAADLTVVAVNRDNQAELARGKLIAFDNQIDQTTGTIKLKASFDNNDKALWPGQFVNMRLLLRTEPGALTVPAQAVQLGPKGSFVYVIDGQQTAAMRSVTTGQSEGGYTIIAQGLQAGEKVVTDGQSRLQDGAKVQASEAAAPATAQAPAAQPPQDATAAAPAGTSPPQQHGHQKQSSGEQPPPATTR